MDDDFRSGICYFMVPVMYLLSERMKNRLRKWRGHDIDTGVKSKRIDELIEVEI